ncbi:MAG: hypothetical protein J6X49_05415 [Victivallales bacterium]|nr:hypothetical protein [Victivallales bacterium]
MKKLLNVMIAVIAACTMSAFAGLTVEWDPQGGTVVKGFDSTATQKTAIMVTSEGEDITKLILKITLPEGVMMGDEVTSGVTAAVEWNKDLFTLGDDGEIDPVQTIVKKSVASGTLTISLSIGAKATVTKILNLTSGVPAKLCDVTFKVNVDAIQGDTIAVPSVVNDCEASKKDIPFNADKLVLNFILLRDTYGFTTNAGAKVELDEDAATVTIDATDDNLFTAQIWDVDKAELVTTDAVEFTAAVASDQAAGTVAVEGGKIVYTPAENYSGDFTINYTATFTGIADANVDGSIDVTVNPVNDAPAIAIVTDPLTVNEGEALTFAVSFSDVDTAWDAFTKTVTLGGEVVEGTWTAGGEVIIITRVDANVGGDVPAGDAIYTFTATNPVGFDAVAHPAKTATAALVVTIDDNAGDDGSIGTANADVTINDVDQATDFGQTAIAIAATPDPAVFGSKLTAEFTNAITDADGDVAEIAYQWYRNGEVVAGETALALKTAVKKGETWQIKANATVKPYGDEIAAEQEFTSNEIAIGNTAPTTEDVAVFIRKADGAEAAATVDITMADVDEDELSIVIKNQGTKGTAVVEGNAIKYTVTDTTTEFYDENADTVTFVVNDGMADSAEATLTVTYRENPPAEIAKTAEITEPIDEVDEAGEAVSFELAISATDSDEVTPNGIKAIEWTADEGLVIDATATEGLDTAAATSTVTIKTNGYATLDGADRTANKEFTVKVSVTDALNAVTTETFKVTVNDVDRKAPATFTIAFDPAEPKTEDALTANVEGEVVDPDGDAITGYKYVWSVNGEEVEAEENVLAADAFKKGDTVAVTACALTKPYDAEEVENDYLEEAATVVIANTVPALALKEDAKLEATEDQEATAYALADFVDAVDPDVTDGVDTLAYTVTPNFGEEVGTLTYDAEAASVTFTPAPDYNTEGLEALPTFSVTVSDGEAETEAVNVEITVAAVNDAPTATVKDVYIQPEQLGQEITVTFTVSAGPDNESAQQIEFESCEYTAPEDGKLLLDGDVETSVDNDEKTISFKFTVAEDAEIGAEGTITFAVKDDGEPAATSEAYTFKVILSGTPWYPTVVLPCEDDVEGLMVRIITDDGKTDVVVKEKNEDDQFVLTPAVYYNSGFKGFPRNTVGDIEIYHWTAKGGTGAKCGEIEEGINVPEYQAPGKAVIAEADAANIVTVSAPLASGFALTVVDEATGKTVANVSQDFVPDGDQMETSSTVTLANLEKGKRYVAVAKGYNPMGEYGEESDEFIIDMTDEDAEAWPGDGEFFPPQNWTTTIATNKTDITFKWPVDAKAKTYTLKIYDGNGNIMSTHTGVKVNGIEITDIPAGNYRWYVETSNGGQSDMMIFTVTKVAGGNPVITGGTGNGNTLTLDAENLVAGKIYKFDVIYFDADYYKWAYQLFIGEMSGDNQLTLTGDDVEFFDSANYIMIRPTGIGDYQTLLINEDDM